MIAITSDSGKLLKVLPWEPGKVVGFHPIFGFVSEDSLQERRNNRVRHGFKPGADELKFKFSLAGKTESSFEIKSEENCDLEQKDGVWHLRSGSWAFEVGGLEKVKDLPVIPREEKKDNTFWLSLLSLLLLLQLGWLLPRNQQAQAPQVVEQVTVQIKPEVQKPVVMKTEEKMPEVVKQAAVAKRAIKQDLGFLGLLGRKDLKKAIGGAQTELKDASAGAGRGTEGSGGEMLVGMGEGLKRVTVGNSGVAGLGGIGTKGAGGGAGGYGNSAIGSGEGKALSTVALSQELMLEGGLDRSVVQATIAKYLSQVRACYEQGLKRNPGIQGKVDMNFEIGGRGNVNFAKVERSSLGDQEVEQCISVRMKDWKFPEPRGGVNVKVSYPFMLRNSSTSI